MRKPTQTLDFWQFDVGLYDDGKVIDLNEKYGHLGEAVYFRILCYIAKSNGYYAELNDGLILYIYRSIGSKWIRNRRIISEVISYCGVCGLFDVNLLSQSIITSCGIQRRWLYAKTKSRAKGYSTAKFWILDDESEPELSNHTENNDNCNNKADNCNNKADKCNNNNDIKKRQYNTSQDKTTEIVVAAVALYEKNICPITPLTYQKLSDWLNDVDISLIEYAIEEAVAQNKRTWAYINAILNNQFNAGRKTKAEVESSKPQKKGTSAKYEFESEEFDYDAIAARSIVKVNENNNLEDGIKLFEELVKG